MRNSKRVGIFPGSFNPIHIGHLLVAQYAVEKYNFDEIIFSIAPQNPFKHSKDLLPFEARFEMVKLCCNNSKFRASDLENNLPRPSYTVNMLKHLEQLKLNESYSLIMGADCANILYKWKDSDYVMEKYPIIVYPRPGELKFTIPGKVKAKFLSEVPMIGVSSTEIRNRVKNKLDITYMVDERVKKYIEQYNLYKI